MTAELSTASLASLGLQDYLPVQSAASPGSCSQGFRTQQVAFLQEQLRRGRQTLDELEEQRDLALLEVERRDQRTARFEAECDQRLAEGVALAGRAREVANALRAVKASEAELSDRLRALCRRRDRQEQANRSRESVLRAVQHQHGLLAGGAARLEGTQEETAARLRAAGQERDCWESEWQRAEFEVRRLAGERQAMRTSLQPELVKAEENLAEAKLRNVEGLQRIQHNEVTEHRLGQGVGALERTLAELQATRRVLCRRLKEGDAGGCQEESLLEKQHALERQIEAQRRALIEVEASSERLQEERTRGWTDVVSFDDKVDALMDQLRRGGVQLARQQHAADRKARCLVTLEAQVCELQRTLEHQLEERIVAEAKRRDAVHTTEPLRSRNRMLEECFQTVLSAQRTSESRLQERREKLEALHVQHDFLKARIDGNEDDRGALRYELRVLCDKVREETAAAAELLRRRRDVEGQLQDLGAERTAVLAELECLRREDMLDDCGRTRPILIESESPLVDRLQINECLFSAQMARKPVPLLALKISHLLEIIQRAEAQAELALQDVMRSEEKLEELRRKSRALEQRVAVAGTWRSRALRCFVANSLDFRSPVDGLQTVKAVGLDGSRLALVLDGLRYRPGELEQLADVIRGHGKELDVHSVALRDSGLNASALPALSMILELCPYLRRLDLRRNCLSGDAVGLLKRVAESIPGATGVDQDDASKGITVWSGEQVRLVIDLEGQLDEATDRAQAEAFAALWRHEEADGDGCRLGADADAFLASLRGESLPLERGWAARPPGGAAAAPCRAAELGRTTFVYESAATGLTTGGVTIGRSLSVLSPSAAAEPESEDIVDIVGRSSCQRRQAADDSAAAHLQASKPRWHFADETLPTSVPQLLPLQSGRRLALPPPTPLSRRWAGTVSDVGAALSPAGDIALKSPASTASTCCPTSPLGESFWGGSFGGGSESSPTSWSSRSGSAPSLQQAGRSWGSSKSSPPRSDELRRTTFVFESGSGASANRGCCLQPLPGSETGGLGGGGICSDAEATLPRLPSAGSVGLPGTGHSGALVRPAVVPTATPALAPTARDAQLSQLPLASRGSVAGRLPLAETAPRRRHRRPLEEEVLHDFMDADMDIDL